MLAEQVDKTNFVYMDKEKAVNFVKGNVAQGDVVMVMGAGDVYKLVDEF